MNLDKLEIDASIRSGWQALDLGLLIARQWWRSLTLAGLLALAPLAIVLLIAFFSAPLWALFIIWWLKPFWERLPLYIASRRLFGEQAGAWSSLRSLPLTDILPWLLWRRFSAQRAFDNPVTLLEGLKGAERSRRLAVLHGKYSDVAIGNQFGCFCIEGLLAMGLLMLVNFFLPESVAPQMYDRYDDLTLAGEWMYALIGLASMVLVMPFHTMAGFALYLNRRIELEAWDIEISFRRLAERKRRESRGPGAMLAAWLLVLGAGLVAVEPAGATDHHDRESVTGLVAEVLAGEDFGQQRKVRKWRFKNWSEEIDEESFPEWMIELMEWAELNLDWAQRLDGAAWWIRILLIAIAVGLVFYLLRRYRAPLGRLLRRRGQPQVAPELMFGLDVTPQSLPGDVPARVMQLWDAGDERDALSLLYRAALSRLIDRHRIAFRPSHTEAECAAMVNALGNGSLAAFFTGLTEVWRRLAYGHRPPSGETLRDLCEGWSRELAGE